MPTQEISNACNCPLSPLFIVRFRKVCVLYICREYGGVKSTHITTVTRLNIKQLL